MSWTTLRALTRWSSWLVPLVVVTSGAFYAVRLWTVFTDTGLFRRIGFDWGLFYSQAAALVAGDVDAMYRVDRLYPYLQRLTQYTRDPDVPLMQWPSPYPPAMAALLAPLTTLSAPVAFGLWTACSLGAVAHLAWRIHQQVPAFSRLRVALILITTLPVVQSLVQGQPVLFLASAVGECILALRVGADFRAGAWLGVLALKPQYGMVLGLYLLWKRRWWAVAGAAASIGVLALLCIATAGPQSLLDYAAAVSSMGGFRDPYANAAEMVNWRALILNARPSIGDTTGVVLFSSLAIGTLALLTWYARATSGPRARRADLELAAVMIATMLVSYHSHVHGLALLALPLALLWRSATDAPGLSLAILAFVFAPTIVFVVVGFATHGVSIDYEQPLWVVWPVANVAVLVTLLIATLRQLALLERPVAWSRAVPAVPTAANT